MLAGCYQDCLKSKASIGTFAVLLEVDEIVLLFEQQNKRTKKNYPPTEPPPPMCFFLGGID